MTNNAASTCDVTSDETTCAPATHADAEKADARRIMAAAIAILRQGEDLLKLVNAEEFARRNPMMFNGSIGGHYRHCLDHFSSWLRGLEDDEVNYDHRERDPQIESDPALALKATREMRAALEEVPAGRLLRPVKTCCEVSYEQGNAPQTASSYGREMVYVVAHAIHHYALISVMARLTGVRLPPHFGVAPSTVAFQAEGGGS
jgi:uncharacterized damage-inducible protein DinB